MARSFHEHLADSLRSVRALTDNHIIQSYQLARVDRERLLKAGCLLPIIRGWYLLCPPYTNPGETTPWYASFWEFIRCYLTKRFGAEYCLSAEASMDIHLGKNYLPPQITAITRHAVNQTILLPHNTSLLLYQDKTNFPSKMTQKNGLNLLPFELALCKMPKSFYTNQPAEAEIALRTISSPETILHFLLEKGMVTAANRIAGGLQHLQKNNMANTILNTMKAAGFEVKATNPFSTKPLLETRNAISPYSARIESLWKSGRESVITTFPKLATPKQKTKALLAKIDAVYVQDAYHSLSIEGYQVTEALIQKIAEGRWQPEKNEEDLQHKNALAAKGYFEAFKKVKNTIIAMLDAQNPIEILNHYYPEWYLALFAPAVTAGLIPAEQLAGFRNHPVYIRNALHVPPPWESIRDCMETLFSCLTNETNPATQAVLAHWLLGFIHPYIDGNGRMARFMMNALLVTHGYPWTIVRVEHRKTYLDALDEASVKGNIKPFADFLLKEMEASKQLG